MGLCLRVIFGVCLRVKFEGNFCGLYMRGHFQATFFLNNRMKRMIILINCDSQSAIGAIDSTVIKEKTRPLSQLGMLSTRWEGPMK